MNNALLESLHRHADSVSYFDKFPIPRQYIVLGTVLQSVWKSGATDLIGVRFLELRVLAVGIRVSTRPTCQPS
jgi:hypothetical protein